jgi:hypothetical protein
MTLDHVVLRMEHQSHAPLQAMTNSHFQGEDRSGRSFYRLLVVEAFEVYVTQRPLLRFSCNLRVVPLFKKSLPQYAEF